MLTGLEIYIGKTNNETEKLLWGRVVKTLTVTSKNHSLFDIFFAGVPLTEQLLKQQIFACGAVNFSREHKSKFDTDSEVNMIDMQLIRVSRL